MQHKEFHQAVRLSRKNGFPVGALFSSRKYFTWVASFLFFLLLVFICKRTLPGASYVDLTLQTDHQDRVQLFCSNGTQQFHEKFSVFSQTLEKDKLTEVRLRLNSMPVNRVRLDTGEIPGTFRVYRLVAYSLFARPALLSPADIYRLNRHSPGASIQLRQDQTGPFVEITASDADPYLFFDVPLVRGGFLLTYGLPLLATGLFFLIFERIDWSRFPAFTDIFAKQPSTGENIDALDGLRGIAAIMVVADHTWGRCTGLGAGGVWLFMSLSGFLLARPFVLQPERAGSAQYWKSFFRRRAQRILPVYYLYLLIIFAFNFRFDDAVRHFLFLQGDGHLWVVPQEMFFYMLVPVIMVANAFLLRGRPGLILLHLITLIFLANLFLTADVLALYGMRHQSLRPYLGVFLAGCTASYLYYGIYSQSVPNLSPLWNKRVKKIFSVCAVGLLLFFLLCSTERLWGGRRVFAQQYFVWFGIAAACLLFSILAGEEKSGVNKILSLVPLRAVSVVSFSLYIFHPLVLNSLCKGVTYYNGATLSGFRLFLITLGISYVAACWIYTYFERPFTRETRNEVMSFGGDSKSMTP